MVNNFVVEFHHPSMSTIKISYTIGEVVPYINWVYYFHAWGIDARFASVARVHDCAACRAAWVAGFTPEEQVQAREAMKLYQEAMERLRQWGDVVGCHALFLLADAHSEDDDIVVNGTVRIPFLRQQHVGRTGHTLCLSDYIAPRMLEGEARDIANTLGLFATTVAIPMEAQPSTLDFQLATLTDRLAEATAEKMHEEIRKHHWGYAPDEHLSISELHAEHFQGIRPAIGYPSLPDQSINHLIDELLCLSDIGVSLSENGAMMPHCSVSGFLFAHPEARYFTVGDISEEQLIDYANRRGLSPETIKKFLHRNVASLD